MRAEIVQREYIVAETENRYGFITRDDRDRFTFFEVIKRAYWMPRVNQLVHCVPHQIGVASSVCTREVS
jgi:hypothetical protein